MTPVPNPTCFTSAARRNFVPAIVALVLVCLTAGTAHAYFERVVTSARTIALGGAFVSVADDPTAVLTNPAGLALMPRPGALATYNNPFGVSQLNESYAAAAVPVAGNVVGASWHYFGLSGALSENVISVALARHLIATTQDASLSVGVSVDFYRAAAEATGQADQVTTGGFGVLLRPFPMIGIGYSVNHLFEGDIRLLDGGPGTEIRRQQAWGLSYKWNNRVTLALETRQSAEGEWRNHAGVEIITHPNLHLRGGVDGRNMTGGLGILWRGVRLDVAMVSHDGLGATYVLSIAYLPKAKDPYAQAP